MGRLSRIHVLAVTLVIGVGIAAGFFLGLMKPRMANIKTLEDNIATEEAKAAERPKVETKLKEAQLERAGLEAKWNAIMDAKMSSISLKDPYKAMFEINAESPTYAPQIVSAIDSDPNVRFLSTLNFPGISWQPPSQAMGLRVFPQGSFHLRVKNFGVLLEWLRHTDQLPRVMEIGNTISITGPSPNLDVAFPVTFYIFYRDAAQLTVPRAGGAGASAARGAGGRGTGGMPRGGGMPGGGGRSSGGRGGR